MSKFISRKKVYVSTDGWRGYQKPIAAVAAANDTGMWNDSPCPSNVREAEIKAYREMLRKNKICSRVIVGTTSNVFCVKFFVCVADEDRAKALEIAKLHEAETRLFYSVE